MTHWHTAGIITYLVIGLLLVEGVCWARRRAGEGPIHRGALLCIQLLWPVLLPIAIVVGIIKAARS